MELRDQIVTKWLRRERQLLAYAPPLTCDNARSGRRESNPHHQLGRLELCH